MKECSERRTKVRMRTKRMDTTMAEQMGLTNQEATIELMPAKIHTRSA